MSHTLHIALRQCIAAFRAAALAESMGAVTHAHRCTDSLREGLPHGVQRLLSTASPHAVTFGADRLTNTDWY
jgi:hypothetical protein